MRVNSSPVISGHNIKSRARGNFVLLFPADVHCYYHHFHSCRALLLEWPPTLQYVPVILLHEQNLYYVRVKSSVADPGSSVFLTTESGIQDLESGIGFFRIPDPKPIVLRT
jgi:hypothetical protein